MTEASCGGGGSTELAGFSPFRDPDFNGALFFLGTVLTYQISLCVHECEEVGSDVFLQKSKNKEARVHVVVGGPRSVQYLPSHYSTHLGLSFPGLYRGLTVLVLSSSRVARIM